MDGTHINCCPPLNERHLARDRKGGVTQNTLACCGFNMRFQYILSGMDGCTADGSMYHDARLSDPSGKCQITYSCLILLSCLNFKNKEDKQNKCDFLLILDLNFI